MSPSSGNPGKRALREGVPFEISHSRIQVPLLVVHETDAEVPWSHGDAVARAWPGAELMTTSGLGHLWVLRAVPGAVRAFRALVCLPERGGLGTRGHRSPNRLGDRRPLPDPSW